MHRVVVIGSGFGALFFTKAMRRKDVEITIVSKTSHHLFQPLLYQVATGILSQGEIAPSTREVLHKKKNTKILVGEVTDVDLAAKTVTAHRLGRTSVYDYDTLIVAAGAGQSYFGNDRFAEFAPGMKTIDDALELRGRIFGAFELAELSARNGEPYEHLITFVVVGAGPTGVEMAGQIAELAHRALVDEFRFIDTRKARVVLVDGAPQVLPPFGPKLGAKAQKALEKLGVEVILGAMVTDVDEYGLEMKFQDGRTQRIDSFAKIWAAGVAASPLGKQVAEQSGAETDRAGRVLVEGDLTVKDHPEVFVIGDLMNLHNYPGVAQVAMQGGKYVAKVIDARLSGKSAPKGFKYFDKGSMATISRYSAVVKIGKFELSGFFAWLLWLFIHLIYLEGFRSRLTAFFGWLHAFVGRGRAERTLTLQQMYARIAVEKVGGIEVVAHDLDAYQVRQSAAASNA